MVVKVVVGVEGGSGSDHGGKCGKEKNQLEL